MPLLSYFFPSNPPQFTPHSDIPPLTNKVILITGGTSGLGKQSILELSKHAPSLIWLAARDLSKAHDAVVEIRSQVADAPIKTLELDLSSFDSIVKAARRVLAESGGRLDILMLNAGVMMSPTGVTEQGYEVQFGINHMGHALLTKLLRPLLVSTARRAGADVRVVVLTSNGHAWSVPGGVAFDEVKSEMGEVYSPLKYGQSKLANLLWARDMAKRFAGEGIKVVSVHPGRVATNIAGSIEGWNFLTRVLVPVVNWSWLVTSVENGARNQLWAATAKREEVVDGEYYLPVGVVGGKTKFNKDGELARKLWEWTERELEGWEV